MPFRIIHDDICRVHADAIVVPSNENLRPTGGVAAAIFRAAGPRRLAFATRRISHVECGQAVSTGAYDLAAKHLIHTVGPKWTDGRHGEEELLRSCYRESLRLAESLGDTSVAFPLIASGTYGYPKDEAVRVAVEEISRFLEDHEMEIILVVFDTQALLAADAHADVEAFIDASYLDSYPYFRGDRDTSEESFLADDLAPAASASAPDVLSAPRRMRPLPRRKKKERSQREEGTFKGTSTAPKGSTPSFSAQILSAPADTEIDNLIKNLDAGFSDTLMRLIDERGLKDSEVYKRANMSRQHFSKIRSNAHYQPKKHTVFALAIALELDLEETKDLLGRAGYALTHADKRDVIVEYFLVNHVFDINRINLTLFDYDQPLLG